MENCDHCGRDCQTVIVQVVNYEGNSDGYEHPENLCIDCRQDLISCNGCGRDSFDPDFVGEDDCTACED